MLRKCFDNDLILNNHFSYDHDYVKMLSDRFVEKVTAELTHVERNGDPERGYPGCVNLSFAYVEGESLLMALKDIALSSGLCLTLLLG